MAPIENTQFSYSSLSHAIPGHKNIILTMNRNKQKKTNQEKNNLCKSFAIVAKSLRYLVNVNASEQVYCLSNQLIISEGCYILSERCIIIAARIVEVCFGILATNANYLLYVTLSGKTISILDDLWG